MNLATLAAALVAITQAWPGVWYPDGHGPETREQQAARLVGLGTSIAAEVEQREAELGVIDSAALVETVWGHEARFDYWVHSGLGPSPLGHQDHGRAVCLGQIHTWPGNRHLPTEADHRALAGLSEQATRRCAQVTLAYLWGHARACLRREVRGARRWAAPLSDLEAAELFAAYGSGRCVTPTRSSWQRARTFRAIVRQLNGVAALQ